MSQLLLLVETSTPATSVALAEVRDAGERLLAEARADDPMRHTALLVPLIRAAFAQTPHDLPDLAAVAVGAGPGSYTALRAGLSAAKGLCLARGLPLIQVSTLRALATGARARLGGPAGGRPDVLAVIHARRREVYRARYRADGAEALAPASALVDADWLAAQARLGPFALCGPAAALVAALAGELPGAPTPKRVDPGAERPASAPLLLADAAAALRARSFAELATAVPAYLKPPHVTTPKPRL